jgi:hypothetical protein
VRSPSPAIEVQASALYLGRKEYRSDFYLRSIVFKYIVLNASGRIT